MVATSLGRLHGRLRDLAATDPAERGVRIILDADAAARLAFSADEELARAGLDVAERAELLIAAAGLRTLAERAEWSELRSRSAAIGMWLPQPPRRVRRRGRARRWLAALTSASVPWPMMPLSPRPPR